ncbi:MAG: lycopene cyclase domain-containing protein [Nakamurella sp.]
MTFYTAASVLAVAVAVLLDLLVWRTGLLRTKMFWATYGIVLFFQFIVNGILTGLGIVQYDPAVILGIRVVYAPIEDIGFGFALVTIVLCRWVKLGRRETANRVRPESQDGDRTGA